MFDVSVEFSECVHFGLLAKTYRRGAHLMTEFKVRLLNLYAYCSSSGDAFQFLNCNTLPFVNLVVQVATWQGHFLSHNIFT